MLACPEGLEPPSYQAGGRMDAHFLTYAAFDM